MFTNQYLPRTKAQFPLLSFIQAQALSAGSFLLASLQLVLGSSLLSSVGTKGKLKMTVYEEATFLSAQLEIKPTEHFYQKPVCSALLKPMRRSLA